MIKPIKLVSFTVKYSLCPRYHAKTCCILFSCNYNTGFKNITLHLIFPLLQSKV